MWGKVFATTTSFAMMQMHHRAGVRRAAAEAPLQRLQAPGHGQGDAWEFKVGEEIVSRAIAPVFCTNDIDLEAQAVVAGEAVGQLVGATAAPLIRSGQVVPLLIEHVTEHLGLYVYYGSRVAQPARVRAFIDLAAKQLSDNEDFVLTARDLAKAPRRRKASARR